MSNYIKSPLNYVGGKYKILDQIIPLFPKNIDKFIDLFGGGFNVGININANKVIYNDVVTPLCDLITFFNTTESNDVVKRLEDNILFWNLDKKNKDAFLSLRDKYNKFDYQDLTDKSVDFYSLILHSFNYQIRFNQKMEYNTPFGIGRSSFNNSIKNNLILFIDKMHSMNITVQNLNFSEFDFSNLGKNDFVYCDPPYLLTTGSYNDGNRGIKNWTEDEDKKLFSILDSLSQAGIKFALSNVLTANGRSNDGLIAWSKKYNTHHIKNSFNNSNYHRISKDDIDEVLITNF